MIYRAERRETPLCEKILLTKSQAAELSGLGKQRINSIVAENKDNMIVYNGNRVMIKRRKLEKYLEDLNTL